VAKRIQVSHDQNKTKMLSINANETTNLQGNHVYGYHRTHEHGPDDVYDQERKHTTEIREEWSSSNGKCLYK
jgi:hypothetical protein